MYFRKLFVATALLVVSSGASAEACFGASPFTDVPEDAIYCTNTEWLKNRNITLGCGGTNFCPDQVVTRASMALFLNRLGVALTPTFFQVEDNPGAVDLDLDEPNSIYCQTSDYTVFGYPRRAQIATTFAGLATGALNYEHEIYYSTDSGATWQNTWAQINRSGVDASHWVSSGLQRIMNLNVGVTYRWGILIERSTQGVPATAADFSQSRCFTSVLIHHWNVPLM